MQQTTIEIGAGLKVFGVPPILLPDVQRENTFENPEWKLWKEGRWSIRPQRVYYQLWSYNHGILRLPRGYYPRLIFLLRAAGLPHQVIDKTSSPTLESPLVFRQELLDYQQQALEQLAGYRTGVLVAPTGAGKTHVLFAAIARQQTTSLVVVHTRELLYQTVRKCRELLGIDPGMIGDGKWNEGPVTIALIQTLARRPLNVMADRWGLVGVDECHHSPAMTWASVLDQLNARYKYGCTATAYRKDRLEFLIWKYLGQKTADVQRDDVLQTGRIIVPTIDIVETNYYYKIDDPAQWPIMLNDLVRNAARNEIIVCQVRERMKAETKALVLTDRIEHANMLERLLVEFSPVVLTGKVSKKERLRRIEQIRQGSARLTIATMSLLGEGIDVPLWNMLFLASPVAGGPRIEQAIGRVCRGVEAKNTAEVIDFLDSRVNVLKSAFRKRQKIYAKATAA